MKNRSRFPLSPTRLMPALLLAALFTTPATAQRLMMPNADGLMLQLFDLRTIRSDEIAREAPTGDDGGGTEQAQHAADLLRNFVEPPLRPGDDLCAIGRHWIAVVADAERIASVERLFESAREHRNDQLNVEIRLIDVSGPTFRAELAGRLVQVRRGQSSSYESVIAKPEAAGFLQAAEAAAELQLAAPTLCVMPLQRAQIDMKKDISFIKDFEVEVRATATIANPVVGTVWEGNRSVVCATFLPGGMIGLRCDVQFQELHQPIPTFETQLGVGTPPVTIQLPRTSGVRLANVAQVTPGSLVVLAAQRSNGNFMVALVQASAVPRHKGMAPKAPVQKAPAKLR